MFPTFVIMPGQWLYPQLRARRALTLSNNVFVEHQKDANTIDFVQ